MGTKIGGEPLSIARQARIAGVCYLFVIAGGMFAALFVRDALVVPRDAARTARSIAEHEALWRWGMLVHLLYLPAAAAIGVILYKVFRRVHATLARLALVLTMADVVMEGVLLTALHVPLAMMDRSGVFAALDEGQRQALGYLAVRLFQVGWGLALLFFAGFCALTGVLILRSRLIPRLIGLLMILAGAGYFVNTAANLVSPPLSSALQPWILIPCFVGELSLGLWLAVKGVRVGELQT